MLMLSRSWDFGFVQICDQDLERNVVSFSLLEDLAIWVPLFSSQNGLLEGFKESTGEAKRLGVLRSELDLSGKLDKFLLKFFFFFLINVFVEVDIKC